MYRMKHFMEKSPNIIAAAIFAVVNFVTGCLFVALGVEPTAEFAGLMLQGETALILVLNLFVVQPNTVTNSQAAADATAAVSARETEIVSYLATATPPNETEEVAQKVVATSSTPPRRKKPGAN